MTQTHAERIGPRRGAWLAVGGTWRRPWLQVSEPAVIGISLAVVAVMMASWTWLTWPDVLVDFGDELYTAWRLADGDALRAVNPLHLKGPLSAYVNAALFRAFGVSLMTLVWANIAWLAGLVVALHALISRFSRPLTAAVAVTVFLTVFAFGQYVGIGNYNYVCPYSHEVTHGLTLSLLALWGLARFLEAQQAGWLAVVGGLLGLVFLTDGAVFCAAAVAIVAGLVAAEAARGRGLRPLLVALAWVAGSSIVAPTVAWIALAQRLPASEAWRTTLGSWAAIADYQPLSRPFYRWVMGTDRLAENCGLMALWTLGYLAVAGLLLMLARMARRGVGQRRWALVAAVSAAVAVGLWTDWTEALRPLPLVMIGCVAVAGWRLVSRRVSDAGTLTHWTLAMFALLLLAKMAFNTHVYHLGFALAMPAAMMLVVVAVEGLPGWIARRGGDESVVRPAILTLVALAIAAHLSVTATWISRKTVLVGSGPDQFRADWRGEYVRQALGALRARDGARRLAVLPEGVMINYLSRRISASPLLRTSPYATALWSEPRLLDALQANPPDDILLVQRDYSEDGARYFGRDYGRSIAGWMAAHYRLRQRWGGPSLFSDRFGMVLIEREASR